MPPADGDDSRVELIDKIAKLDSQYTDQVDEAEANWMKVIDKTIHRWRTSWGKKKRPKLNPELARKFRVCFPLAAHALNHIEAAAKLKTSHPWVAKSSARIAFEHALIAQWVLWTEGGEDRLHQQMALEDHKQATEFVDSVIQAATDTPELAEPAQLAAELRTFIGEKPPAGWSVFNLCERFSSTRLLYGVYRDLSQAIHPSFGLIQAHFEMTAPPELVVGDMIPSGSGLRSTELTRGMAVSALWALYVLEVSRADHKGAVKILRLGEGARLPVDLRASDLRPELQPGYKAIFTP